jgi:hypothetical protein
MVVIAYCGKLYGFITAGNQHPCNLTHNVVNTLLLVASLLDFGNGSTLFYICKHLILLIFWLIYVIEVDLNNGVMYANWSQQHC